MKTKRNETWLDGAHVRYRIRARKARQAKAGMLLALGEDNWIRVVDVVRGERVVIRAKRDGRRYDYAYAPNALVPLFHEGEPITPTAIRLLPIEAGLMARATETV